MASSCTRCNLDGGTKQAVHTCVDVGGNVFRVMLLVRVCGWGTQHIVLYMHGHGWWHEAGIGRMASGASEDLCVSATNRANKICIFSPGSCSVPVREAFAWKRPPPERSWVLLGTATRPFPGHTTHPAARSGAAPAAGAVHYKAYGCSAEDINHVCKSEGTFSICRRAPSRDFRRLRAPSVSGI